MKKSIFFIFLLLAATIGFAQKTIYVNQSANGQNNGIDWTNAFTDLQTAFSVAVYGDNIWVAKGVFKPDPNGSNRNLSFELPQGVRLIGSFSGTETSLSQRDLSAGPMTVLSGNIGNQIDSTDNSYTILYLSYPDTNTIVDGFELRHGFASSDTSYTEATRILCGGAVFVEGKGGFAFSTFRNCVFRDNYAERDGGAIFIGGQNTMGNTPIFTDCRFENNKSGDIGGAIFWEGGSNLNRGIEFYYCSFTNNIAQYSTGALEMDKSFGTDHVEFVSCRFEKNASFNACNVLYCQPINDSEGSLLFDSCFFSKNFFASSPNNFLLNLYSLGSYKIEEFSITNSLFIDHEHNNAPLLGYLSFNGSNTIVNIVNNRFINNRYANFSIGGANTLLFRGNIVKSCNGAGKIGVSCSRLVVCNNDLENFQIASSNVHRAEVIDNLFFTTDSSLLGYPTDLYSTSYNQSDSAFILNNLFLSYKTLKILSTQVSNLYIKNNTFLDNKKVNTGQPSIPIRLDKDHTILENNSFDFQFDTLANYATLGSGNILVTNPLFRDTAIGDFRLQPCSPLVNAGSNANLPNNPTDLAGTPRIQGGSIDIGPYETPAPDLAALPTTLPACPATATGAVAFQLENGCEPYQFNWSSGNQTGQNLSNLAAGSYLFTITDARGSSFLAQAEVSEADSLAVVPFSMPIVCGDTLGGSVTVVVSGGQSPFHFLWQNGTMDSLLTNLSKGSYAVTVSDARGCTALGSVDVDRTGSLSVSIDVNPISCFGEMDGSLTVLPTNGKAPFVWNWQNGSNSPTLGPLGVGNYYGTLTDSFGCDISFVLPLSQPDLLEFQAKISPATDSLNADGSISLEPILGGTQPYTAAWSNGLNGLIINGLAPGFYTVTLTDAHDCSVVQTIEVSFTVAISSPNLSHFQVELFPNPSVEKIIVRLTNFEWNAWTFRLHDALGRVLLEQKTSGSEAIFEANQFPAGLYHWEIVADGLIRQAGKLVKQ